MPSPSPIELNAGALRLVLRADLGGAIGGLWFDGLPVLRSSDDPAALTTSRASGCYPLVPYSNRLGYARFRWAGHDHRTRPNFDPGCPHSLHGVSWQRPWTLLSADATQAEMEHMHTPDEDWPFAYRVTQRAVLTPEALRLELAITNTGDQAQPVGLGWHPYFVKRTRSRLHVECTDRWDSDPSGLPTRKVAQPGGIDGDVAHLAFDHCFEGWRGAARIRDEKLSLRLTSSLGHVVVYTPAEKPIYCVEPVSHVSNAIHMSDPAAHGLRTLQPGETFSAWMSLEVAPA
jgi:aldose 1-epimerase